MVCYETQKNRKVSISKESGYTQLDELDWDEDAMKRGEIVRLQKVPFPVRIFKLETTDSRIDWIITNDLDLTLTADVVKAKNDMRCKVEE